MTTTNDQRDAELNARLEKSVLDCIALNFDNLTGADLRRAVFNADTAIRDTALRLSRCSTPVCIIAAQQVLSAARNVLANAIAEGLSDNDLFKRDVQRNMPDAIEVLEAEIAKHTPALTPLLEPVCPTCGGEGDCPDCMNWGVPLTVVLADLPRDTESYKTVEAAILVDYPLVESEIEALIRVWHDETLVFDLLDGLEDSVLSAFPAPSVDAKTEDGGVQTIAYSDVDEAGDARNSESLISYLKLGYVVRVSNPRYSIEGREAMKKTMRAEGAARCYVIWADHPVDATVVPWAVQVVGVFEPAKDAPVVENDLSKKREVITRALQTGRLPDRLEAEAIHAIDGTTSVSQMAQIMKDAAGTIRDLETALNEANAKNGRLVQYRTRSIEIVGELMTVELSDKGALRRLVNALWELR